jgi:hypothetical protein
MLLYLFVSCAGTSNGEKDGKKIKSDGAKGLAVVMDTEWRRLIVLNHLKNKAVHPINVSNGFFGNKFLVMLCNVM